MHRHNDISTIILTYLSGSHCDQYIHIYGSRINFLANFKRLNVNCTVNLGFPFVQFWHPVSHENDNLMSMFIL